MNTRNRIKTLLFFAVAAMALILAAAAANAELVVEEQFSYSAADINTQDGGIGFGGAWVSTQSHGQHYKTGIVTYASGDGTTINEDTGLYFLNVPVAGSALSRYGNAGRAEAHRLLSGASQTALTADNTTIWFGVLISADKNYANMMFCFGTESIKHSNNTYEFAAVGDGFGVSTATTGGGGTGSINAFVFDNSDVATFVNSTFTPVLQDGATHHDTALMVGKINWKANGTPDEFFLFNVTDPNTEPDEADAIATITADLNQSAFDTIAMYDGTITIIDEIRFGTTFDNAVKGDLTAPSVDAGSNWITWSGETVTLDDVAVVNNSDPQTDLTYAWTAEPADGVVFSATDVQAPTITITKPAGNAITVTLTLAVNNVGSLKPDRKSSMKIDVYDNSCLAAEAIGGADYDLTDLNTDCNTDIEDFAQMAATWLVDYQATGPDIKP